MRLISSFIVLSIVLPVCVAIAQEKEEKKPEVPAPPTKLVVYDIRALVRPVQNFPGNMSISEEIAPKTNTVPQLDGSSPPQLADSYIKLIEETVDPESWKDNGGATGVVREIDGLLIVRQTESAHRDIAELLAQVMSRRAKLVRVRIHWLIGTAEQLKGLNDADALSKLPADVAHHVAETVCLSGQTVHVTSIKRHSYISDFNPVVSDNSAAQDPMVNIASDGAMVRVTPTIQPDGNTVSLDLQSVVTAWNRGEPAMLGSMLATSTTKPSVETGVSGSPAIDRPDVPVQSLETTLQVPLNKPVMVGGMTLSPSLDAKTGPQMRLVVEVSTD